MTSFYLDRAKYEAITTHLSLAFLLHCAIMGIVRVISFQTDTPTCIASFKCFGTCPGSLSRLSIHLDRIGVKTILHVSTALPVDSSYRRVFRDRLARWVVALRGDIGPLPLKKAAPRKPHFAFGPSPNPSAPKDFCISNLGLQRM
jgi:hypothetical protein